MQRLKDYWDWLAFWPFARCMWCSRTFWRGFLWGLTVDVCSKKCSEAEMDWCDRTHSGLSRKPSQGDE